jgi:hypothetical protein
MPVSALVSKAIEYAQKELDNAIQEDPKTHNSGIRVDQYLKAAGCVPGDDWCMAFLYWCFQQAASELKIPNPLYKTGNCHEQWAHSVAHQNASVEVGDLIVFVNVVGEFCETKKNQLVQASLDQMDTDLQAETHISGHIGIVTKVDGEIFTIEGNTTKPGHQDQGSIFVAGKVHPKDECRVITDKTEIIGKRIIQGYLRF